MRYKHKCPNLSYSNCIQSLLYILTGKHLPCTLFAGWNTLFHIFGVKSVFYQFSRVLDQSLAVNQCLWTLFFVFCLLSFSFFGPIFSFWQKEDKNEEYNILTREWGPLYPFPGQNIQHAIISFTETSFHIQGLQQQRGDRVLRLLCWSDSRHG